ncbi:MAG: hypothetical protein ACM3ZV_07310 [Bacillota bacterium]
MVSVPTDQDLDAALLTLERTAAACHVAAQEQTVELGNALRVLMHGTREQWPFQNFWRSVAFVRQQERWSNANAALNAIYLAVGRRRDLRLVSRLEAEARGFTARSPAPLEQAVRP